MSSWSASTASSARGRAVVTSRVRDRREFGSVVLITAALLLLAGAPSAHAALSILPGRPGGKPTPKPTGTPIVTGTKGACQEQIRSASAALAISVRGALAECLATAMPCVLEQGGAPACCGAAAPACVRRAEDIAAAEAAFVADVVSPPCSTLAFADLESEGGLDFARTEDACLRLDPPVAVDGLGSLATCLERLVTEDVLHLATTAEQPRALEALVCMDLENRFPGVLRERPATCENLPAPTPTPSPAPSATPGASPGSTPTPAGSPGAPTPTPGTATPTPAPTSGGTACTQADVTLAVNYNGGDFPDVAGITVSLKYPGSVSIPGFGGEDSVKQRVTNLTGVSGGLFNVGDQDADGLLNIGLISIGATIPPGGFARVRFDCASGATLPVSGAFTCTVDASTSDGNPVTPSQCVITVAAP